VTKLISAGAGTAGTNFASTITVTNNGPAPATSVVLTENLPSALTFVSCGSDQGGGCGGSGNNRTVSFASLPSGVMATITLVTSVNCTAANGTRITNTASVA
jgi:uncharacterized repeat protein (TIGR01451 family)